MGTSNLTHTDGLERGFWAASPNTEDWRSGYRPWWKLETPLLNSSTATIAIYRSDLRSILVHHTLRVGNTRLVEFRHRSVLKSKH
jgi:hypothetical protein